MSLNLNFNNIHFINDGTSSTSSEETNLTENKMYPYEGIPGFWIYIPRSHARMETTVKPNIDHIPENDRYEFYIFRQIGSSVARRDTYVLYKLPSGRKIAIRLFMDGGADWVKEDRKFMLRETDELDRRIILGFCYRYQDPLADLSRTDFTKPSSGKRWLEHEALDFTYKMVPKRLKKGSFGNDYTDDYRAMGAIDPWDESSSLFDDVNFLN